MGSCKPIAWNGIQFNAPADWDVAELGLHYLLLENRDGPVLEIKWGRVRGPFSHKKQLRRLVRSQDARSAATLREIDCPQQWEQALPSFIRICFAWAGRNIRGKGIILYCPECRKTTFIQFYQKGPQPDPAILTSVLASFQDHATKEGTVWAVFDIRAKIPKRYRLTRHRFLPGEFEITFASKGETLSLHRWGPASILLSTGNLQEFARRVLVFPQGEPLPMQASDVPAVEWAVDLPKDWPSRFWRHLRHSTVNQKARLWWLQESNRILGVRISSRRCVDTTVFEKICVAYDIS